MKRHHGVLLALSPFFVYGALTIPYYIFEILELIFEGLSEISNPFSGISSGIWLVTVIFFPLGIAQLQYTKGLFRLWLAPLNLLGLFLGWAAVILPNLESEIEKGLYIFLGFLECILIYAAVVNLIYCIIYAVKKHKEKAKSQNN